MLGPPKLDTEGKAKKASGWDNWKAKKFGLPLPGANAPNGSSSSSSRWSGQGLGPGAAGGGMDPYYGSGYGQADLSWQQQQQQLNQPEFRRSHHKGQGLVPCAHNNPNRLIPKGKRVTTVRNWVFEAVVT